MPTKSFVRMVPGGGANPAVGGVAIDPATLPWELLLDSRTPLTITVTGSGRNVERWPDTSGNARHANNPAPPEGPHADATDVSPNGLQMINFLHGGVPYGVLFGAFAAGINVSAGMTTYVYLSQDVIDANSGGPVNADLTSPNEQQPFMMTTAPGEYQPASVAWLNISDNPGTIKAIGGRFGNPGPVVAAAVPQVSAGIHILTTICYPPQGTGRIEMYYDGVLVASGSGWTQAPQTGYWLNGVNGASQFFKGKLGFVGFASSAHGVGIRTGIERFLRRTWG